MVAVAITLTLALSSDFGFRGLWVTELAGFSGVCLAVQPNYMTQELVEHRWASFAPSAPGAYYGILADGFVEE